MTADQGTCRSCNGSIIFGRTPAGKLMPLEYNPTHVPDGTLLNVAYFRHSSGRTECLVLTQTVAAQVASGTPLELAMPDLTNAEFYSLTVAHFVTCPAASMHRKARRGEVPGVAPFPAARRRSGTAEPPGPPADVTPLRPRSPR